MFGLGKKGFFSTFSDVAVWAALLCLTLNAFGATGDEGLRADLPPGGELRIENGQGGVSVEVWGEKYVSVAAKIEGATPSRSPVVIERTERLLSVGVLRDVTMGSPGRVDLTLHIPERARAQVITTGGAIDIHGAPAVLAALTVSGDIRAEFTQSSGVTLRAQTSRGAITSAFAGTAPVVSEGTHVFKIGDGGRLMTLRSESGRIMLVPSGAPGGGASTEETRRPPTLIGTPKNGPGAGVPASASTGPQEVDESDVIRVDTELVTTSVSVVDRGTNRGLAGLTQSDFKLYEDGVEQQVAHFDSSAAPFNLFLLIDLSGSTREVVNLIRGAALRFVDAARPSDRIAVITFAGTPVLVSRLTNDRDALHRRINAIEQPHGSTKLYDSLAFTMGRVLKDSGDSRRNAIVLMSDGLDSSLPNAGGEGSKLSYKELLGRVREFDGVLYTLWLNTEYESLSPLDVQPETFDAAYDRMKELAEAGGGMFYEVEELQDLAGAYERVVADLGTVYSLTYRPANKLRDGKWRTIRVAVARPNAVARGKRGYNAN